jgi:hypothetical protein
MAQIQSTGTSNVDENVQQQELLLIVGGNAKWYCCIGRQSSLAVSFKTKNTLAM